MVRERLEAFAGEVLAGAMNRPVQVRNGGLYLRGLIEDGARKSLEPLVLRLGADADYQSMQQFLADSPWDPARVVQAVAERVAPVIGVEAWVLDDTGFPKDGKDSPGVKRQYTGTLGKIANCQIGVSVHAVGKTGTVPLGWALYLPEGWCEDAQRRRKAKIPEEVVFKTKVELGVTWSSAPVAGRFRGRRCSVITTMAAGVSCARGSIRPAASTCWRLAEPLVFEHGTTFERKTKRGAVRKRPRPDRKPEPLGELIARLGQASRRPSASATDPTASGQLQLHPHARARRACAWRAAARTPQPRSPDAELPPREEWLIAEWLPGAEKPIGYWLSNLPADTTPERLARLARLRWRIELDYKQLKGELGLDHYEGRSWLGWYHHTALVTAAHGFLTLERLNPFHPRPA